MQQFLLHGYDEMEGTMHVTAILFDEFETLDVFGPVEMLGASGEFDVEFYSSTGGIVKSYQAVPVDTLPLSAAGYLGRHS